MALSDKKRILLAFYPLFIKYNHGIALLSRLCKDKGIDVELYLLDTLDAFGTHLHSSFYDYVCISCVSRMDYEKALPFAAMAQAAGRNVLLGGTWAPMILEGIENFPRVCRGDGESLPDFILNSDCDVLFRTSEFHRDLNSLPLPDYDLFAGYPFNRGYGILDHKSQLPYFSSRGCPHHCTFCLTRHQVPIVRVRTKVEEDLTELTERYKPDLIFMGDALIPYYSAEWRKSWGDFRHPFFAYIHAGIEPEILEWLIERGLTACLFGVESGDEAFRNEVLHKDLTDDQLFRTVEMLTKYNVSYAPFYIVGLPGESFKMKAKTFKLKDRIGGFPVVNQYDHLEGGA